MGWKVTPSHIFHMTDLKSYSECTDTVCRSVRLPEVRPAKYLYLQPLLSGQWVVGCQGYVTLPVAAGQSDTHQSPVWVAAVSHTADLESSNWHQKLYFYIHSYLGLNTFKMFLNIPHWISIPLRVWLRELWPGGGHREMTDADNIPSTLASYVGPRAGINLRD